jgi:hypothetical protein
MGQHTRFAEEKWSDDFAGTAIDGAWIETLMRQIYGDKDHEMGWNERGDAVELFFVDAARLRQVVADLTPDRAFEILDECEAVSEDSAFSRSDLEAFLTNLRYLLQSPSFEKFTTPGGISILVDY